MKKHVFRSQSSLYCLLPVDLETEICFGSCSLFTWPSRYNQHSICLSSEQNTSFLSKPQRWHAQMLSSQGHIRQNVWKHFNFSSQPSWDGTHSGTESFQLMSKWVSPLCLVYIDSFCSSLKSTIWRPVSIFLLHTISHCATLEEREGFRRVWHMPLF